MSAQQRFFMLYLSFFALLNLTNGLHLKPIEKKAQAIKEDRPISDSQWTIFKTKLGLTDQKVQMLKSQKDQKATAELIKQFMKENSKYITVPAESTDADKADKFHSVYQGLIKQLQAAKGSLKASLNFELADKSAQKQLKRSPRKIAFKMVSDIPSEKIDDLLEMFSEQHGLNKEDPEDDLSNATDNADYTEIALPVSTSAETDYEYENLWEDGEDPHTLNVGPQFGSFQDLFMQASRQRMQREMEESKLNKHFV